MSNAAPKIPSSDLKLVEDLSQYQLATIKQRFFALMLDGVFSTVLAKLILVGIALLLGVEKPPATGIWLIHVLYYGGFLYLDGQTLGKRILKIRVVSDSSEDGQLTLGQALGRETLGRFCSSVVFSYGYFVAIRREDRKAWHDSLFKTRVISYKGT